MYYELHNMSPRMREKRMMHGLSQNCSGFIMRFHESGAHNLDPKTTEVCVTAVAYLRHDETWFTFRGSLYWHSASDKPDSNILNVTKEQPSFMLGKLKWNKKLAKSQSLLLMCTNKLLLNYGSHCGLMSVSLIFCKINTLSSNTYVSNASR